MRQESWSTSVIPALWKLIEEDRKFKATLGYTVRHHLKNKQTKSFPL
jgi:hypothetical protein